MPAYSFVINTDKTAVVDVEQVFEGYYKTKEAREDIDKKRKALKESLEYKQKQIAELENKYKTISSTNTANSPEKQLKPDQLNLIQKDVNSLKDTNKKPDLDLMTNPDTQGKNMLMSGNFNSAQDKIANKNNGTLSDTKFDSNNTQKIEKNEQLKVLDLEKAKGEITKQIEAFKVEMSVYESNTNKDIDTLEKDFQYNITGEIYEKISFIARRAGYNAVFDKKDLIYSGKNYDLTDLVVSEINKSI